jgi:23S rRNA (cytosine1962-C5)-methyltransferase
LPELADGALIDIVTDRGRFVGRGFYQATGGIAVRLLTRRDEPIDAAFVARRIARAKRFRDQVYPGETVYRWAYAESDRLPGMVADRYGPVVSVQAACSFYAQFAEDIAKAFQNHDGVRAVRMEIASKAAWYGDPVRPLLITLDGAQLEVNVDEGQKTGLFLDQRENARAARSFAPGARVFDGHCYNGLWSCHAALAGAADVHGVDTSAPAIARAAANARLNGVDERCRFEVADVRDALNRGERYDVVLLDPPALAKSRGQVPKALGLYQTLNRDAARAVEPGGILVTSSCSHFVEPAAFLETLKRAVRAAQREAWVVEVRGAARDHPVLMAMPETAYLTCVVLRVF